jgi:two-component system, OmpR family, alkaline phosphatase synthesis response regulator PhoP
MLCPPPHRMGHNMADSILVVDDDKALARLVRSYLEESSFHVLIAHDGETALHIIRAERPLLVVLDLMLPQRDGWEITRIIRADAQLKHIGIVMLTARIEDVERIVGLELGADDYMVKPFNPRELIARVRTVIRRLKQADADPHASTLSVGNLLLNPTTRQISQDGQPITFTPTEFKIMHLLMSYPNRVFTRAEIVEKVFGYQYATAERVLDTHIRNLRRKLGDEGEFRGLQTVYGVGYRLSDERGPA